MIEILLVSGIILVVLCACSNIQLRHRKGSEYKEMAENSSWRTLLCLDVFFYININFLVIKEGI